MSTSLRPDKAEEAAKLFKKAEKYWAPSLLDLRLKPDWEAAAPLYEKSALAFKVRDVLSWVSSPQARGPCRHAAAGTRVAVKVGWVARLHSLL